jgi:hypothetical protein
MSDLLKRALWTFAQAFLSTVALGLMSVTSLDAAQALAIAGVAAGLSALKTFVVQTM